MHPLKVSSSLHAPPAPVQLQFLPLTYAPSKVSSSLHAPPAPVLLRFLPLTYAPSKGQQFTARSARSSQFQTQTGTVMCHRPVVYLSVKCSINQQTQHYRRWQFLRITQICRFTYNRDRQR